ncbi:MAG: UDP-N-acetylmuramate:L-alanyl-gamma-D-glutamyl-meso-diaminopimelate ligase [Xanthomonadales bacterium]|nr:UDP-N-acetylmuramate:L-alanyl-gamma-D-glutamyl-meso-diaminopimelate ligase [Xanthomonadales bacterium]NIN60612.1 UDP-N-acetylmuramate:L-alanyl-gamma-D-glutamyl-meso-diaminopimelate ligase [Xanthomonadales bacterium]NIN75964.1 UDP-N-acetylmuramate:L-alanyl-gamma-D-glutamyl-meso-diaminopimelate ligase [Xanthomonadales bacterium]NIO15056.1 UDP-N-acetylmuramate:L-alanyl-gamma-D-glutamyl-meso-diaminopimelate ligase [Xanthomonadales bacterium]NIP13005.1 UDP-N-acetylmuramate:L-alanyl-gamma-D-glutam
MHILGACGTFMGGVALLARRAGYTVSGSDQHTYPPMSTLLHNEGIELHEGYDPAHLEPAPDLVVIGNALSRGNPAVEHVLNQGLNYCSGPRWLGENYLRGKFVIAVAGTHGKTTTSSMVAWILESAGLEPGFLIGGVPLNFNVSARDGAKYFVVEADEYDTAFFDKRAKFVHYRPQVAILNNLEYDHADIYPDLASIQTQFHHLVRTIPGNGTIISNAADPNLEDVLERGCWSGLQHFSQADGADWQVTLGSPDGRRLSFHHDGHPLGTIEWSLTGRHNALNACAALAASAAAGIDAEAALNALSGFRGVKRRLELLTEAHDIRVYDDFAHHPTAIRLTLEGLRRRVGNARILVALEPRSNTMRAGVHADELGPALIAGDFVWLKTTDDIDWEPKTALAPLEGRGRVVTRSDDLLAQMLDAVRPGDHVVFMSNGGFDAAPARFSAAIEKRESL